MKKVIGILSVAFFAMAMFFNANTVSISNDVSLAGLMNINSASADPEDPEPPDSWYRFGTWTKITVANPSFTYSTDGGVASVNGVDVSVVNSVTYTGEGSYTYWDCIGWVGDC